MRQMRNSGIKWIEKIPAGWSTIRFKFLHNGMNTGEAIDKEFWSDDKDDILFYTAGIKPIRTNYSEFPEWKYTKESDLLLARNGTPYVFSPEANACYTDHIIRADMIKGINRRFVQYGLQQSINSVVVDSVSLATWSASLWNEQVVPYPSFSEQQIIADYLDCQCAHIDNIIEKTKTSIEEYNKLKQAIITQAVTKGIHSDRSMKDSGIDWLGEIPDNWIILSLKYLCYMQSGKNITSEQIAPEGNYPVYGGNGIRGYYSEFNTEGDHLIVGRQGALCGNVHSVNGKFWATEHAVVTTPTELSNLRFLYYLLIGMNLNQYASNAAAQPGLAVNTILNVKTCLVPLDEQIEIVSYLDEKCLEIDTLIAQKEDLLTALEAYRSSMIYEYVTGKKEVTG